jgi:dephospho-CoA kinase
MLIIGLTGSIGMGKSTTLQMFADEGVPVYDADAAVHAVYSSTAVPVVEAAFPGTTADGKVDRQKLSQRVLGNPDALKKLEQIVHPLLGAHRQKFLEQAETSGAPIVLMDVPLLFETGGEKRMDAVVVVSAPAELQRERVLARESMTQDKLDAILARQMPDGEKRKRADFVVDTSRGLAPVRAEVKDILAKVAKMPQRRQ